MESTELPVLWNVNSSSSGDHSQAFESPNVTDFQLSPEYKHFRDMSRLVVTCILYPIIMCVGVLGNSITIVILTRRRMRSSTNHYLTALAFSDLFYLIFAFTLTLNHYQAFHTYYYYSYFCVGIMLTDACSNTSVWLTVTFTIERYIAVCHPIRGKVLCTRSRAKKVIGCVVLFCFAVVIPTPFEYSVVEVFDEDIANNRTTSQFQLGTSSLGENETYKKLYYWFTSITFVLLPLTLLVIFNSFLIRSVHQSKTQRRRMTMRGPSKFDNAHQENRITIMLIAVVIMFLLCQLPTAVTLVYNSLYTVPPQSNREAVLRGLGNIFNLLVAINAACNFILYCAFSDRYRRTFLRTFMPCLYRLGSPNHSQTNLTAVFTKVCQESDMDHANPKRRLSNDKNAPTRCRRPLTKNQLNSSVKNGHSICNEHQKTNMDQNIEIPMETNEINESLIEKNSNHLCLSSKSHLYLLDNGHLTTHDDNGSDTTQETIVSNTEMDTHNLNDQRKRVKTSKNEQDSNLE